MPNDEPTDDRDVLRQHKREQRKRSRSQAVRSSKICETRVLRYLSDLPDAQRSWKDRQDITLEDAEGRCWYGEVKERATAGNAVATVLSALAQVEQVLYDEGANALPFAFLHKLHGRLGDDLVAWRLQGIRVVTTAAIFKREVLGFSFTTADPAAGT